MKISIDPDKQTIEIEGVKYSFEIFRTLAFPRTDRLYQFKRCGDLVIVHDHGPAPHAGGIIP